ncbi:tRNA (guanosine(18)-2'-O)-methyltransferase [Fundidesulfovibrio magnetotacticus]|uniref:tRNA (guanosine(18)-2'-O)-methyltransferase n=1 Tax=Fundidesulfovibrio magnetotacticus TaxID=2730080 RepID=A0A6V8LME4_9BACT|nr:TrmH family RNA methyltransferase [Fundidesulfovibrio magnetotacticus]GFK92180.1 tRNA (guanosine(18)-2'-O)-methyltransferase [Fundidesulfovibrio magnetotacticus]
MRERTDNRKQRILDVLARRQNDLTIVLNNIHDPHNVSAVLRSCDAFGVGQAHLLYTDTPFPQLGHKSSASAKKWVELVRHRSARDLVGSLRERNLQVLSTGFGGNAKPLHEWDMTLPTAVILGNEHDGVAGELQELVTDHVYIPMQGMVQSLNVSVAAAVVLYEAFRQRMAKGMYDAPSLTPEEISDTFDRWIVK